MLFFFRMWNNISEDKYCQQIEHLIFCWKAILLYIITKVERIRSSLSIMIIAIFFLLIEQKICKFPCTHDIVRECFLSKWLLINPRLMIITWKQWNLTVFTFCTRHVNLNQNTFIILFCKYAMHEMILF